METNVKYRIVKSGENYAIQKKHIRINTYVREVYSSRFSQKEPCGIFTKHDIEWHFLKPTGNWNAKDEDIVYVGSIFCFFDYTRIYKTKKAAQDALKQHLWDTMVEPIDGQEEWKQVNKD